MLSLALCTFIRIYHVPALGVSHGGKLRALGDEHGRAGEATGTQV